MWNLKQIPKVCYLYWGKNKPLSYMHFKTVESFSKMNPDWKIKVFYPTQTCTKETWETGEQKTHNLVGGDHFPYLTKFDNVEVKSFDMEDIGFSNDMPEVFKSDIIRLYLLKEYGGVWSDFDIIYTKPMSCLLFNKKENQKFESFICDHYYFNSVGFLMSAKGSDFYGYAFAETIFWDSTKYQSLGRDLFRKVLDDLGESEKTIEAYSDSLIYNMPFEAVYPYAWNMTDIIFGDEFHVGPQSIGCHWYAGSEMAGEIASSLEENIDLPIIQCMENISEFKLGICLPLTNDFVHSIFMDSFVRMHKPKNFVYLRPQFPAQIDAVRNQLVEQGINAGCTHLLFLDTDQDYPVDLIEKLASHNKDFVGGAVCRRYPIYDRIAYRGETGKYTRVSEEELDKGELIEVDATGGACLMVKAEVFLHVGKPWFSFDKTEDGKIIGEDVNFSSKAREAGYKIHLDPSLDIGHMGILRVDRNFSKFYQKILDIGKK